MNDAFKAADFARHVFKAMSGTKRVPSPLKPLCPTLVRWSPAWIASSASYSAGNWAANCGASHAA
jgi:hypothetical protein